MSTKQTGADAGVARVGLAAGLVVVTALLFAGAVFAAGGIQGVMEILGLSPPEQAEVVDMGEVPPRPELADEESSEDAENEDGSDADVLATAAGAVPTEAREAMYREQLQSQTQIKKLVNDEVAEISFGTAVTAPSEAEIPLTVTYRSGDKLSGTLVLANSEGLWLFSSLTADENTPVIDSAEYDTYLVDTIVEQQATASNQTLVTTGLINGGFERARVDGVTEGAGTVTIELTLLGGELNDQAARFVCIKDDQNGTARWFLTRFELR